MKMNLLSAKKYFLKGENAIEKRQHPNRSDAAA